MVEPAYNFQTNSNEEVIIKLIGRITLEFNEFEDFQEQIKLRRVINEVLYQYDVKTKEKSLVTSDIEEKMIIFFASKKLEGMSKKTVKNYNYILGKFSNFIRKPLTSISTNDMRMYLAMIGKNLKPGSVNALIYCFKSFFSWLVDNDYLQKNPMSQIKATKIPKRSRNPLTEEEIEILRQNCVTDREKSLIEFLISTGCRLGEIVGINIEDINWHEHSLNVIGKGDKERKVYFSTRAKVLLQKYINNRKSDDNSLFLRERAPYTRLMNRGVEMAISKIALRSGFAKSIFPHIFRHSFATHNLNIGMNLSTLQSLMGHESSTTTMIYAQLSEENIKHEYHKII